MNKKFHIVYFICLYKLWKEKTLLSYENIIQSNILNDENLDKMYIIVSGDKTKLNELTTIWKHPKIDITFYSENIRLHEFPGIEKVKTISHNNPNDSILYYHSKGITRGNAADDWVAYLEYFNILHYKKNLDLLNKNYDAVSVEFLAKPLPHFSGNFWWANCNYINKLKLPPLHSERHAFEFFIGNCNKFSLLSLHQSIDDSKWFVGFNSRGRGRYNLEHYKNKFILHHFIR